MLTVAYFVTSYGDLSQRIVSRSVDQLVLSVFQGTYKYSAFLPIQTFVDENEIQEPNYLSINCISDRSNYSVSDIIDINVNVGLYFKGFWELE